MGFFAGDPTTPLHCSYYVITSLLFLYFLQAYELRLLPIHFLHPFPFWAPLANIPTVPTYFHILTSFWPYWTTFLLYQPTFHILASFLGSIGPHSYCANPFHSSDFLGPFISSLPLLLLWAFAKSFELPWPNYHILTSYYLLGLLAFMSTL